MASSEPPTEDFSGGYLSPETAKRLQRSRLVDKLAARLVSIGGVGVLLSVVAIFVFIGWEVLPLFSGADAERVESLEADGAIQVLSSDEYREHLSVLTKAGRLRVMDAHTAELIGEHTFETEGLAEGVLVGDPATFLAVDGSGRLHSASVETGPLFDEAGDRTIVSEIQAHPSLVVRDDGGPLERIAAVHYADEDMIVGVVSGPGFLGLVRFDVGGTTIEVDRLPSAPNVDPTSLEIADFYAEYRVYAGYEDGRVFRWDVELEEDPELNQSVQANSVGVSALGVLKGQETLIVGGADGSLVSLFGVRGTEAATGWELTRIREMPSMPSAVTEIVRTPRGKGFVALDDTGDAAIYYHTTGRRLMDLTGLSGGAAAVHVAPKNDAVYVAQADGGVAVFELDSPHPEATFQTLFLPVWYESGPEPELKWQSTGGTDEFEPKLSLTVLVWGSLKGVIYALIFSIPVALLAAIYVGLYMPARIKSVVKPAIELMAAIPSVIIGLLAALWLSPVVDENLAEFFALFPSFGIAFLLAMGVWITLPRRLRVRTLASPKLMLWMLPVVIAPLPLAVVLGPLVESTLFGGDAQQWLLGVGWKYDPRNAMVVGFAMGFAVVPVIFTIAEDAISNVPKSLWAASEALGATRWQTTAKVVLPAAAPGIFGALMLGFGRAIGETMIVLMATGNTPILDISPFNGMRTISACIAVEIPEAPHGGTLYRVLFLAGVLLFSFTFICNTAAEVVGQRLRRKMGRL